MRKEINMTNKTQTPVGNDKVGSPCIFISSHDLADEDIQVCIEALGLRKCYIRLGLIKNIGLMKQIRFMRLWNVNIRLDQVRL